MERVINGDVRQTVEPWNSRSTVPLQDARRPFRGENSCDVEETRRISAANQ
jgi:hypothetical protein